MGPDSPPGHSPSSGTRTNELMSYFGRCDVIILTKLQGGGGKAQHDGVQRERVLPGNPSPLPKKTAQVNFFARPLPSPLPPCAPSRNRTTRPLPPTAGGSPLFYTAS